MKLWITLSILISLSLASHSRAAESIVGSWMSACDSLYQITRDDDPEEPQPGTSFKTILTFTESNVRYKSISYREEDCQGKESVFEQTVDYKMGGAAEWLPGAYTIDFKFENDPESIFEGFTAPYQIYQIKDGKLYFGTMYDEKFHGFDPKLRPRTIDLEFPYMK